MPYTLSDFWYHRVDSFSNMGGFLSGILLGILLVPAEAWKSRRATFILWSVRIASLILLVALFVMLVDRFYQGHDPDEASTYGNRAQNANDILMMHPVVLYLLQLYIVLANK